MTTKFLNPKELLVTQVSIILQFILVIFGLFLRTTLQIYCGSSLNIFFTFLLLTSVTSPEDTVEQCSILFLGKDNGSS